MLGTLHPSEVDPVDEHCELRGIQLRAITAVRQIDLEFASIQAFAPQHQAALLKRENLGTVATTRNEDEEVAAVDIFASGHNHSRKTIEAFAHVDCNCEQQDPRRHRKTKHGLSVHQSEKFSNVPSRG